jgi:hypothetical protein
MVLPIYEHSSSSSFVTAGSDSRQLLFYRDTVSFRNVSCSENQSTQPEEPHRIVVFNSRHLPLRVVCSFLKLAIFAELLIAFQGHWCIFLKTSMLDTLIVGRELELYAVSWERDVCCLWIFL